MKIFANWGASLGPDSPNHKLALESFSGSRIQVAAAALDALSSGDPAQVLGLHVGQYMQRKSWLISVLDQLRILEAHGRQAIVVADGFFNRGGYHVGGHLEHDKMLAAHDKLVSFLADEFPDVVAYYQVGNEPEFRAGSGGNNYNVTRYLDEVRKVKSLTPPFKILAGRFWPTGEKHKGTDGFGDAVGRAGDLKDIALGYHLVEPDAMDAPVTDHASAHHHFAGTVLVAREDYPGRDIVLDEIGLGRLSAASPEAEDIVRGMLEGAADGGAAAFGLLHDESQGFDWQGELGGPSVQPISYGVFDGGQTRAAGRAVEEMARREGFHKNIGTVDVPLTPIEPPEPVPTLSDQDKEAVRSTTRSIREDVSAIEALVGETDETRRIREDVSALRRTFL